MYLNIYITDVITYQFQQKMNNSFKCIKCCTEISDGLFCVKTSRQTNGRQNKLVNMELKRLDGLDHDHFSIDQYNFRCRFT